MTSNPTSDREADDADKVSAAIEALMSGNLDEAEPLLLDVVSNTPAEYSNWFEEKGSGELYNI